MLTAKMRKHKHSFELRQPFIKAANARAGDRPVILVSQQQRTSRFTILTVYRFDLFFKTLEAKIIVQGVCILEEEPPPLLIFLGCCRFFVYYFFSNISSVHSTQVLPCLSVAIS